MLLLALSANLALNAFVECCLFRYSAKVEGVHKEFQKAVRAGVCRFIPETGALLMISTDEASQKKARMIQEMHFRNLSQKVNIRRTRNLLMAKLIVW